MAKTIGFRAMLLIIFLVNASFADNPKRTSAPATASARVRAFVLAARAFFHGFMPSLRPW